MVGAYDFSRFRKVLDVGGSYGALLSVVLKAHPHLTGAVVDLPFLAPDAEGLSGAGGVGDRGRFIAATSSRKSQPASMLTS